MPASVQHQQLFRQARQAYSAGRRDVALALCNRLLSLGAVGEEVLNLKGLALLALERPREARTALAQALKHSPRSSGLHLNAARVDLVLADRRGARRHIREAVRHAARDPRVLYQAALLSRQSGDYPQAFRLLERCTALAPELAEAGHLEGSMRADQGDRDAAIAALETVLVRHPDHARSLADLSRLRPEDTDGEESSARLEGRLRRLVDEDGSPWDRSTAAFALADRHHRAGNAHRAAARYRQANRLGATVRPFDLDAWERKQASTLARTAALAPLGAPGEGHGAHLVFLVGMPRSGTSLAEQIIAGHPDALPCGELHAMHAIESHFDPAAGTGARRRHYLDHLPREHARHRLVTDKLPMNFERIGMIHELFPGARFVHCRRHPLATAFSCYQQDFQAGVQWAFDLDAIARVLVAERRLMAHWSERLPEHVHTLPYEHLVSELDTSVAALAAFLGVDVHPDMLAPHRGERTVQTASRLQVREPVHARSIDAWRAYEDLLGPVSERLRKAGIGDEGRRTPPQARS